MSNINKTMNKVKRALTAKGIMPLINNEQFYNDEGKPITKYIIHYGKPRGKDNDVIDIVYSKVDLLTVLIDILRAGVSDG